MPSNSRLIKVSSCNIFSLMAVLFLIFVGIWRSTESCSLSWKCCQTQCSLYALLSGCCLYKKTGIRKNGGNNKLTVKTCVYTAVSRKVVGKSARDNPERYCGWFLVHCFSKKFQRMAREATDICLRVLKEGNSVLVISHITFRDCRVHSFCDNLSRNSCI